MKPRQIVDRDHVKGFVKLGMKLEMRRAHAECDETKIRRLRAWMGCEDARYQKGVIRFCDSLREKQGRSVRVFLQDLDRMGIEAAEGVQI